ncbi:hypothetical protein ACC746_37250, partial [Rhizobium ruizarguesonis]
YQRLLFPSARSYRHSTIWEDAELQITKREFLVAPAALALASGVRSARAAIAINYWHHFASQSDMAGMVKIIELFGKS